MPLNKTRCCILFDFETPIGTMIVPLRALLAASAMAWGVACGGAGPTTALGRVASLSEKPNLDALYRREGVPLLLIGNSVYVPPCACLDQPCVPRFGGVAEARAIGQSSEGRAVGQTTEARDLGQAAEARRAGGAAEGRESGTAVENRAAGTLGEARVAGVAGETRRAGAEGEQRLGGAESVPLTCRYRGSGRFEVFSPTAQPIRVFDLTGTHDLPQNSIVKMY